MEETVKNKKKGISLIVLVITIIVILILAVSIIITLSRENVVGTAKEAVAKNTLQEVQELALLYWSEVYLSKNGDATHSELKNAVISGLESKGIEPSDYLIEVTNYKVIVEEKDNRWKLDKTVTNGVVTAVAVTDGVQTIDVGSTINYMSDGIGTPAYKGGWKILGVDEYGRILIMSNESITGSTLSFGGKDGFKNAITLLNTTCENYIDGRIGVDSRSIKTEDIDALTSFDKMTYKVGQLAAYGNEITYSWDGTEYPQYSYGSKPTIDKFGASHASYGFTYYDIETKSWKTSKYTKEAKAIATLKCTNYNYVGASYLDSSTLAYKMIFRNVNDTANTDRYWLASQVVNPTSDYVVFGSQIVMNGEIKTNNLFFSDDYPISPANEVRAVVTLSVDAQLTESKTALGTYDVK